MVIPCRSSSVNFRNEKQSLLQQLHLKTLVDCCLGLTFVISNHLDLLAHVSSRFVTHVAFQRLDTRGP